MFAARAGWWPRRAEYAAGREISTWHSHPALDRAHCGEVGVTRSSLARQLARTLTLTILCAGLVAAAGSFFLAYFEATEFQDDMLKQIARLDTQGTTTHPAPGPRGPGENGVALSDQESRILVLRLPRDARPDWLAADLAGGFHTVSGGPLRFRVFIQDTPAAGRIVVAQTTDARDEIAIDSALRTLIPLLLVLPLLAWLLAGVVRRELAPVTRLSRSLDEQSADRLDPIAEDELPDEIAPFVFAINRLLQRVNLLIGQQRRFIADAAHELRSPLTAISLQAQNLGHAGSLESARERLVPLQQGIERARQLTEQLLSLAGTQAGANAESTIDVSATARGLIADNWPLAEARNIDLGLEEATPVFVQGAPETFRLILKNGLDNAMKYSPVGGEVTVRLRKDGDTAVIEIADNGPGISAPERDRAFDPFYRIVGATGNGSGLGLAIAREAANRLGGTVSLHEGEAGRGLVFRYRQRSVSGKAPT